MDLKAYFLLLVILNISKCLSTSDTGMKLFNPFNSETRPLNTNKNIIKRRPLSWTFGIGESNEIVCPEDTVYDHDLEVCIHDDLFHDK